MNTRYLVLLLILGAIAAQCVYYYPQMPAQVASHFTTGGRPNGWMSRDGFFAFYGFMIVILTFSMFVLPLLLQRYQSNGNQHSESELLAGARAARAGLRYAHE